MKKDYRKWHEIKSKINNIKNISQFFKARDVWYFSCGLNIGHEQDGKGNSFRRPVLILYKFNKHVFWGVPLISIKKKHSLYFEFGFRQGKKSWAIISQLKLVDSKRLIEKIGRMNIEDFCSIKKKIRRLLE